MLKGIRLWVGPSILVRTEYSLTLVGVVMRAIKIKVCVVASEGLLKNEF